MRRNELSLWFGILLRILSRGEINAPYQQATLVGLADRLKCFSPEVNWLQFENGLYDLAHVTLFLLANRTLELSVHQLPNSLSLQDEQEARQNEILSAYTRNSSLSQEECQELEHLIQALATAYEIFGSHRLLECNELERSKFHDPRRNSVPHHLRP